MELNKLFDKSKDKIKLQPTVPPLWCVEIVFPFVADGQQQSGIMIVPAINNQNRPLNMASVLWRLVLN